MSTVNFRRGERVRVTLSGSYRHFLDGLEGTITAVLHHGVVVSLENPPSTLQKVLGPSTPSTGGLAAVGPKVPVPQQYVFQFHEVEKVDPC